MLAVPALDRVRWARSRGREFLGRPVLDQP